MARLPLFGEIDSDCIISADEINISQEKCKARGLSSVKWCDVDYLAKGPESKNADTETFLEECKKILMLAKKHTHPCIEQIAGIMFKNDIPYLIAEYTDMTLADFLQVGDPTAKASYENKVKIVRNITSGLRYLHDSTRKLALVHCALCCDNILVSLPPTSRSIQAKISDLSKAGKVGSQWYRPSSRMFPYLPPAYRIGAMATECRNLYCETHVDVYCLAVVIVAIETQLIPSLDQDSTVHMDKEQVLYSVAYHGILNRNLDKMWSVEDVYRILSTKTSSSEMTLMIKCSQNDQLTSLRTSDVEVRAAALMKSALDDTNVEFYDSEDIDVDHVELGTSVKSTISLDIDDVGNVLTISDRSLPRESSSESDKKNDEVSTSSSVAASLSKFSKQVLDFMKPSTDNEHGRKRLSRQLGTLSK